MCWHRGIGGSTTCSSMLWSCYGVSDCHGHAMVCLTAPMCVARWTLSSVYHIMHLAVVCCAYSLPAHAARAHLRQVMHSWHPGQAMTSSSRLQGCSQRWSVCAFGRSTRGVLRLPVRFICNTGHQPAAWPCGAVACWGMAVKGLSWLHVHVLLIC